MMGLCRDQKSGASLDESLYQCSDSRLERLRGDELSDNAVDAVSESGGLGAVIEDMPLMALASGAVDFGPCHKEFGVGACLDHAGIDRLPEARPAGAAIELMLR